MQEIPDAAVYDTLREAGNAAFNPILPQQQRFNAALPQGASWPANLMTGPTHAVARQPPQISVTLGNGVVIGGSHISSSTKRQPKQR